MKIEIAESLIYSYLKHIEECRVVQTNWATSGKWVITEYDKEKAKLLFEKLKQVKSFKEIFKNNSLDQLLKQAEIDVIGLNTVENSIFGVDVAFHAAGINYGDRIETTSRIMKKIFRTIFIMQSYFKGFDKFHSYFATPKINPSLNKTIDSLILEAIEIINDDSISIKFISNEEFYSYLVEPLLHNIDDEYDTIELFSRSIKLLKLDPRISPELEIPIKLKNKKKLFQTEKRTHTGMKIGQFVQYNLRKLFEQNLLSPQEIQNLQNKEYSKRIFNQNFEVLRNIGKVIQDEYGHNRYYTKETFCGNYYLTNSWFEYHFEPFKIWLSKFYKQELNK